MEELFFRVDVNEQIATGHLCRCLSIADAAKERGIRSVFIFADDNGQEFVQNRGYESVVLNSDWSRLENEIDTLSNIVKQRKISLMIVDSYSVTDKYLGMLSKITKVIYIDDLGEISTEVAGLLHYSNYYKKFRLDKRYSKTKTQLYLGCEYVPLRKAFYNCPSKIIRDAIKSVLLLTGGSDAYHVTKRFLQVLSKQEEMQLEVICGKYSPDYDELREQYKADDKIHIYRSVNNIETYMKNADVAISAGGTALYELCACGTPTITFSIADNQIDNVSSFLDEGLMSYLGDARYEPVWKKLDAELNEMKDANYRSELSKRMMEKVDGNGANRFVGELIKSF